MPPMPPDASTASASSDPDKRVRFALLGAGVAADFHHRAIEASTDHGIELTAVAHYDPERFDEIEERFGGVACARYDDVLARPAIDAIIITTPSGQHAEQAVRAAQAGKHVLVEKPMALHSPEAERMIAACQEAGVQLGVVFQRRAEPLFQQVHQAVEAGDFGRLTLGAVTLPYFRSQAYYEQAPWRGTWAQDGGGVLMNQGIHLMDLLLWYFGDPVAVSAEAGTLARDVEVEDVLAATLRFAGGAAATITATTTADPGFPHRLELYGTEGGMQIEGETVRRWTLANPEQAQVTPPQSAGEAGAGAGGAPEDIEIGGHVGIIRNFAEAIRGQAPPLVDGREGRRSLQAIRQIYDAAGVGSEQQTAAY